MQVFHIPQRHRSGSRKGRRKKLIDIPKSGRCGDGVRAMHGKNPHRRSYVMPRDPRSAAQRQRRDGFGDASKAWGTKRVG